MVRSIVADKLLAKKVLENFLAGNLQNIVDLDLRKKNKRFDEKTAYYIVSSEINLNKNVVLPKDYNNLIKPNNNEQKRKFFLATLLLLQKSYPEAEYLFAEVHNKFGSKEALYNLAYTYKANGDYQKCVDTIKPMVTLKNFSLRANILLANTYSIQEDSDNAISTYLKIVKIDKKNSLAWYNLAIELEKVKNTELAIKIFTKNVHKNHCDASANWLANYYIASNDFELAHTFISKALKLSPNNADYYNNLGNLFQKKRQLKQALKAYQKAMSLGESKAEPFFNAANVFREMGTFRLAIKCYDEATQINPQYNEAWAKKIYLKACVADFSWELDYKKFKKYFKPNGSAPPPLSLTFADDDPAFQKELADRWMEQLQDYTDIVGQFSLDLKSLTDKESKKIKIAYLTGDTSSHAVSRLSLELFKRLDRDRFTVICVIFSKLTYTEREPFCAAFDELVDVSGWSIPNRIDTLRKLNINIAFDMCGHTKNACTEVFKARISGCQINFLGQPGTMGGTAHDFILADKFLIPNNKKRYYSEEVVYLPHGYMPGIRSVSHVIDSKDRQSFGFVSTDIIFWTMHNPYKISKRLFDCWLRILKRVENGVLWLLEGSAELKENLISYAKDKGIHQDRLVFTQRLNFNEYINTFTIADIFLDTQNYSAGSTAQDAVSAGIPVISTYGKTYASRMCGSILQKKEIKYKIVKSLKEYENYAVSWSKTNNLKKPGVNKEPMNMHYLKSFENMLIEVDARKTSLNL